MPLRSLFVTLYTVNLNRIIICKFLGKVGAGLILKKKEEVRCLDVDHFYDMIRTAQDDQVLKVLT